jgi:hypothetical protein
VSSHRVATLALCSYAAVLALAAVPPEVRPPLLGIPGESARRALRSLGIRPGVAVFEASVQRSDRVVRNDYIRVRSIDRSGRATRLAPPGACETQGARFAVPWTEGAIRSLVLRAPAGVAEPAIGDWICHGPHWHGRDTAAVELLWTEPWLELASGVEGVDRVALFIWRCEPPGLARRSLHPSEAEVQDLPPDSD